MVTTKKNALLPPWLSIGLRQICLRAGFIKCPAERLLGLWLLPAHRF